MAEPRKTPLYDAHQKRGARIIDFGGWWMPVQYATGIIDEHRATRTAVGVFDVCHMGEVHFRGPRATAAVQRLVSNDVGNLPVGRALYTVACTPAGGIVDDLIVYRLGPDHLLIVVNASNAAKDVAWFRQRETPQRATPDGYAGLSRRKRARLSLPLLAQAWAWEPSRVDSRKCAV